MPSLAKEKNKRIASVEFWRFFFTVLVCWYHLEIFYSKGKLFPSGTGAVEFFFVLSGFLLALSVGHFFERNTEAPRPAEASALAAGFVWKKIKAIFPVLVMVLIIHIAVNGGGYFRKDWLDAALNSEWELLFMVGTPFGYNSGFCPIVPLWFLTALFIAGYVYCYLLYRHFDLTLFLSPLIGVLLLSYFTLNSTLTLDFMAQMGLLTAGTVKAFAEMALGISIYRLYSYLSAKNCSKLRSVLLSILLTVLLLFCVYRYFSLTVNAAISVDNFRRIIYIMLIILLSFLNKDVITKVLNNRVSRALGSISMTMYICHYTLCNLFFNIVKALQKAAPDFALLKNIKVSNGGFGGGVLNWYTRIAYILFVILVSVILHLISKGITRLFTRRPERLPEN